LFITYGVSGSGKTTGTTELLESIGAVRVRTDIERKRLAGLAAHQSSGSPIGSGIYSSDANRGVYHQLRSLAAGVIKAGFPVIVDGTFLGREQRDLFRELAATLGVPFHVLPFTAGPATLRQRIQERQARGGDASEATLEVLDRQLRSIEPLGGVELPSCTTVAETIRNWRQEISL
jgi:predicted kinase